MNTSMKFFKDMGVCDGAYAALNEVFEAANVEFFDYDAGLLLMNQMRDVLAEKAATFGEDGHDQVEGWFKWCDELRNRPEAIMYFGDHIEKYEYRTLDGLVHASLEEAQQHEDILASEARAGYRENFSVCGIKVTKQGETWQVLRDLDNVDWSYYDKFSWTEFFGGQRFETPSPTEAFAHYAYMTNTFEEINRAAEVRKTLIKRKVADNTDTYEVWV